MNLSTTAAILCGNPKFQQHIGVTNTELAAAYLRRECGVGSRRELDTNKDAADRFHAIRRAFAYGGEA